MIGTRPTNYLTAKLIEPVSLTLPIATYFELFQRDNYGFLLDSALPSATVGQYSYVGGNPFLVYRATRLRRHTAGSRSDPNGSPHSKSGRTKSGDGDFEFPGTVQHARCEVLHFTDSELPDQVEPSSETIADPFAHLQSLLDQYAHRRPRTARRFHFPSQPERLAILGMRPGTYWKTCPIPDATI